MWKANCIGYDNNLNCLQPFDKANYNTSEIFYYDLTPKDLRHSSICTLSLKI